MYKLCYLFINYRILHQFIATPAILLGSFTLNRVSLQKFLHGLSMKFKDKEYKDCPLEVCRKSVLSDLYSTKIPYVGVGIVKVSL